MSLVTDIAGSRHRLHDGLRVVSVWVAGVDDGIASAELAPILAWLPDLPGGFPLTRIAEHVRAARRSAHAGDLVPVFDLVRHSLGESSRDAFLRLVVDVAAADGRIAAGEKHALMFVADLIGRAQVLPAFFEESTGIKFTLPEDPDDPVLRAVLESDDPRQMALSALGLSGDPPQGDIRHAFRRLAAVHHPDRYAGLGAETVAHATAAFQRIEAAYRQLAKDSSPPTPRPETGMDCLQGVIAEVVALRAGLGLPPTGFGALSAYR